MSFGSKMVLIQWRFLRSSAGLDQQSGLRNKPTHNISCLSHVSSWEFIQFNLEIFAYSVNCISLIAFWFDSA
jgi:hypothetical protein